MLETLDPRLHLSATLSGGVLTITGSNAGDVITADIQGDFLIAFDGTSTQRFKRVDRIEIFANSGNDDIAVSANVPTFIRGSAGNDRINGGPGNDRILGDSGNDEIYGHDGSDRIDGGGGSDLLSGGAGRDTVDYSRRTEDLYLSILLGKYDDGARGENDFIRDDIEGIDSGAGDDEIFGWYGEDAINGGDGHDTIYGDRGRDTINGDGGDDEIYGNAGNDRLHGGDGDDFLDAGNGENLLYGGRGDDRFDARNDSTDDGIDGGGGFDRAWIDINLNSFDDDLITYDKDGVRNIERLSYRYI